MAYASMISWVWLLAGAVGGAAAMALVSLLRREDVSSARDRRSFAALDTVMAWPPEPSRILGRAERDLWRAMLDALPGYMLLAKVPLARFVRVPKRNSFNEWLTRVGYLSADFVVCDPASDVIAVVQLHTPSASERSERRHLRMKRVLAAAGIRLVVLKNAEPPTASRIRELVLPDEASPTLPSLDSVLPAAPPSPYDPLPLPDTDEVDEAQEGKRRDPPPSTWYTDLDSILVPLSPPPASKRRSEDERP